MEKKAAPVFSKSQRGKKVEKMTIYTIESGIGERLDSRKEPHYT